MRWWFEHFLSSMGIILVNFSSCKKQCFAIQYQMLFWSEMQKHYRIFHLTQAFEIHWFSFAFFFLKHFLIGSGNTNNKWTGNQKHRKNYEIDTL